MVGPNELGAILLARKKNIAQRYENLKHFPQKWKGKWV